MPGFDGTGPRGMGPMTGGGRGLCAVPYTGQNANFYGAGFGFGGRGFGRGFGRGGGRGWRNRFYATGLPGWGRTGFYPQSYPNPYLPDMNPEEEIKMLKSEEEIIKKHLDEIEDRIKNLETFKQEDK